MPPTVAENSGQRAAIGAVKQDGPGVMVIAAEPATRASIEAALAPLSRSVVFLGSSREALARLAQRFGLIIFDVHEPASDALETARLIRSRDRDTGIIFVTADPHDDDWVARAYELELIDVVFKPLAPDVLRAKARTFMQIRALRDASELRERELHRRRAETDAALAAGEIARMRAEFLANANAILTSSLDYEATLAAVARAAVPVVADWCIVELVDGDRLRSVASAEAEPTGLREEDRARAALAVIRSGVSELCPVTSGGRDGRQPQQASAMIVPIKDRDVTIGAITFVRSNTKRAYSSEGLAMAASLGEDAGAAVANARLYEAAAAAVRLDEIFSGIVGHDLRNPLASIMATAHVLLKRGATPADAELLDRIVSSTERMARMIDQLLDFTRIRAGGGIPSDPEPTDLSKVIGDVLEETRVTHPTRELVFDRRGSLAGVWDADRLAQLVSNLVSNAVEHGTANTPVAIQADGSDPAVVTIRVSNDGAIPEALAPVVFEPFRGIEYKRSQAAGLGLGLYIAQQIALVHGGKIELVTADPRRTTFLVLLPRSTNE